MDSLKKCEIYHNFLKNVNDNGELKEKINLSIYENQIKLVKNDLVSKMQIDQDVALQILSTLVKNNVHNIYNDVVSILKEGDIKEELRNTIMDIVKTQVQDLIRSNNVSELVALFGAWQNYDVEKFSTTVNDICQNSKDNVQCKKFLLSKLLPYVLDIKIPSDPSKLNAIDLALNLASIIPPLTSDEYGDILNNINNYLKVISELRDINFVSWHKQWMLLIRLFGRHLHSSMNLMNKLLRVVEHAFRNASFDQRLKGYDCWRELIDNRSLDSKEFCSEKQIKLLLTPLSAKFSRQEAVIVKRFDVFVYLLEKLQDKAVLVLKQFLEFCFGAVGEESNPHKVGQGKSLSELWIRSAKVLLAVLGHSHELNEHCLETQTEINFKIIVLRPEHISAIYYYLINSVVESSKLLKEVELNKHKNNVLRCLWKSLLNVVLQDGVAEKKKCVELIGKVLDDLIKHNDPYCNSLASIIFKVTMHSDEMKVSTLLLNNVSKFVNVIFSVPLSEDSYIDVDRFLVMLSKLSSPENSPKLTKEIFVNFINFKRCTETNVRFIAQIWIFLAEKFNDYAPGNSLDYLAWPVVHLHQITDTAKQVSVYEHYKRQLMPFVERSDELHLKLFKYFEKTLKNNPLLLKNILDILTMFNPKISNNNIINVTLEILSLILLIPSTTDDNDQRETIESYLKKIYESNISHIQNQDTIKKLCSCVEQLLKLKHYNILPCVEESLTNLPENIKWLHSKFLTLDFLVDLLEKETDLKIAEKIHKIIEHLRNLKDPETKNKITSIMPLGGRSAKIANLVKQMPVSPGKRSESPSIRLFGKDIETHAPLKVISSQLKAVHQEKPTAANKRNLRERKQEPLIEDENSKMFVHIDTQVNLCKDKLTEHQKETLKKRRDDIPALYQDLSQSISQTMDSSSAENSTKVDSFKKPLDQSEVRHFDIKTITDNVVKEANIAETPEKKNEQAKKQLKAENELKRLSLNIVGAEDFIGATSTRKREKKLKVIPDHKDSVKSDKKKKEILVTRSKSKDKVEQEPTDLDKSSNNGKTGNFMKQLDATINDALKKIDRDLNTEEKITEEARKKASEDFNANNKPKEAIKSIKSKNNKDINLTDKTKQFEKKRKRRSFVNAEASKELRKSRRKTHPTDKFLESELFLEKKLVKDIKQIPTKAETQSELFKETETIITDTDKTIINSETVKSNEETSKIAENKLNANNELIKKNGNQNSRKRKRLISSSEDDESYIVESSQESNSKFKWSLTRKSSLPVTNSTTINQKIVPIDTINSNKVDLSTIDTLDKEPNDSIVESKPLASKNTRRGRGRSRKLSIEKTPTRRSLRNKSHEDSKESDASEDSFISESTDSLKRVLCKRKHDKEDQEHLKKEIITDKELMEVSTESVKGSTQDTATQNTEPMVVASEVQFKLDLPQKPLLSESEEQIARMDTASIPLDSEINFNESSTDKTVIENKTDKAKSTIKEPEDLFNTETTKTRESEDIIEATENLRVPENSSDVNDELTETEVNFTKPSEGEPDFTGVEILSPSNRQSTENVAGTPPSSSLETSFPSLPASPVTVETPNRTSELLSNTSDISPIGSKSNSESSMSDDEFVERKLVPVALKFDKEDDELDAEQKSPEKGDDASQKIDETSSEKAEKDAEVVSMEVPLKDYDKTKEALAAMEKTAKFPWLNQASPAAVKLLNKRKIGNTLSPSASRIRKLMSKVKPPSQNENIDDITREDILTFSREVPSPLAVPKSSILKRKYSETYEEGASPMAKRKRVNFSDPCTTSKKVFIREEAAASQHLFSMPPEEDIDKQFLAVLSANNVIETPQTESDTTETELGHQENNPLLLQDDLPIYPNLIDCEESINVISRKLTGPMFVNALLSKLSSQNIKTIGDLANQSELSIARLSFKTPMVGNVYRALDNYYNKNFKSKDKGYDEKEVANQQVEKLPEIEAPSEKVDVKEELIRVLQKAKSENVPTDTLCSLVLKSSDKTQVLKWTKKHFNLQTKDLIEESDFTNLLKHLLQNMGVKQVIEIISKESPNEYYDCVSKDFPDDKKLDLIKTGSVHQLRAAIWENVDNEVYSKTTILDTCFLPYIKSIDLVLFYSNLTVVEISDIVINRLNDEEYKVFINKIITNSKVTEKVKNDILENYSISDLTSNISQRATPNELLSSITRLVLATDKNKEDLVQIVTDSLVSHLPPSKILDLSIELLNKYRLKTK